MYYDLCGELEADKAFLARDYLIVMQLCKLYDLYIQGAAQIKSFDDCVEHYKNGSNVSGIFTAFNRIQQMMLQLYPQMGIGLKSRQTITQYINNQLSIDFPADPWKERAQESSKIISIDAV